MTDETTATERRDEKDRVHKYDVFADGDVYPWKGKTATVIEREVVAELPDPLPSYMVPNAYDPPEYIPPVADGTDHVLVTLRLPVMADDETVKAPASFLARRLKYGPNNRASVDVRASYMRRVAGEEAELTLSVPSTGSDPLTPTEARELADMLRRESETGGVTALLARAANPDEVLEVATQLETAAEIAEIAERIADSS